MVDFLPVELTVNQITSQITSAISEITGGELAKATKNLRNMVKLFGDSATNGEAIASVNERIAETMRIAVQEAYVANVIDVRSAPSYREGDRFAGRLYSALKSPSMAVGTAHGIEFINTGLLDQTARQWARLNFGAGPAEGRTGAHWPRPRAAIRFGSQVGIPLALTNPPRPNFNVPQKGFGHFTSTGEFFLGRPTGPKGGTRTVGGYPEAVPSARGIAPRRFLDAGLVALGKNFGPMYQQHFKEAVESSLAKGQEVIVP